MSPNVVCYGRATASNVGRTVSRTSDVWSFKTTNLVSAVERTIGAAPELYTLSQNYPNPFNPSKMIPFALPKRSVIRVSVYSLLGIEVAVLVSGETLARSYEVRLDAGRLPFGVYLTKMQAAPVEGGADQSFVATRKIVLTKQ